MHRALLALMVLLVTLGAFRPAAAQVVSGTLLAPANRQVAELSLDAPRPRLLTGFASPAYVSDIAASPSGSVAAVAVSAPFGGVGAAGGDILAVDLSSYQVAPLVSRTDAGESLGSPAWWFGSSKLLFQREDVSAIGIAYPGAAAVHYPSRIESVESDGSNRTVLVADGRQPAVALDGAHVAFVRTSERGSSLLEHTTVNDAERVLVPEGRFIDMAYPRYAPQGGRIAFMAAGAFVGHEAPDNAVSVPLTMGAMHGVPWDLWVVNADGSGAHQLAQLGADDGSVAWSPSGTQLFVYGGTGSFLVDAATGVVTSLEYVAGYGGVAWLP